VFLDDGTRKFVLGAVGLARSVEAEANHPVVRVVHTGGSGALWALTDASGVPVSRGRVRR
jgi:hypothetical protein